MKHTAILALVAAAATGFVIPDEITAEQLSLNQEPTHDKALWQDVGLTFVDKVQSTIDEALSSVSQVFDGFRDTFSEATKLPELEDDILDFLPGMSRPRKGHHGHHPVFNFTIYEAIKKSNYTTTFAKIVDKYPDLVAALNSTSHNLTVFVPTDKAFEKIPEHHKKPSKEFVEQFLQYHIVSDLYSSLRVLHAHTLPTALKEDKLGGNPQRIRVGFGLGGLKLNFYSRIIAADIFTSNGVVHGLDNVLVPPPHASHLISLFPQKFSTVILAAERTHLGKEFHGVDTTGGTLFLPTNRAFEKLGPAANAFLFNTEKGIGYLKALLKYHIVLNETLYSDAYYGRESDGADDDSISGHYHVDLPTLLAEKSLSIDIASWGRLITIKINGRTHVSVSDGVVKEGVIHVVESVLIPPHKHKDGRSGDDAFLGGEEINVEDLVERLEPYLEKQSIGEL